MRRFVDDSESFKYLVRSKKDKDTKKSFDEEVIRASRSFVNWYRRGDSLYNCELKTRNSYGGVICEIALVSIYKSLINI